MKRIVLLLAAMLCAACLSGCVPLAINLQRTDDTVPLPLPDTAPIEAAVGDSRGTVREEIEVRLISEEYHLVPVKCEIELSDRTSRAEEIIRAQLGAKDTADAKNPFPKGCTLLGLERSGNAAVVDLSIEARAVESERQLLWMHSALSAALSGVDGIEYVNLLIAGRSEELMKLPAGLFGGTSTNMNTLEARLNAERDLVLNGESAGMERQAVLYYAERGGKFIIPVVRTVRLTDGDFITPLLDALSVEPTDGVLCSPLRHLSSAMVQPPEIVGTEDGRQIVRLTFDPNLIATLEREGLDEWQLYASLTYTITGFVPEIDGLVVQIGDGQLTRTERNGQEITFPNGEMRRSDYPDAAGTMISVYMTSLEGGLVRLERAMNRQSALSARTRLAELFRGVEAWETGAARVMPDGVSIDDVLGVRIEGNEAVVNFSSNFYRCCQILNRQQERSLIYSLVNTLCELPSVRAVRFQIEGETVDHLVSEIFLRGALMPNIGIVK